jgi:putative transposase
MDNVLIERFWRTIKYEEVYLKEYTDPQDAYHNLAIYIEKYNNKRLHSSLDYKTP